MLELNSPKFSHYHYNSLVYFKDYNYISVQKKSVVCKTHTSFDSISTFSNFNALVIITVLEV